MQYMNYNLYPQEILSSPIAWYNYPWWSTKYRISSGAGAYTTNDYYSDIGIIGHIPSSCAYDNLV